MKRKEHTRKCHGVSNQLQQIAIIASINDIPQGLGPHRRQTRTRIAVRNLEAPGSI
jgi:hypothetical protein